MHIIILLDTSLSMIIHVRNVLNGLNNFIKNLKNQKYNNVYLTLASFNNDISYLFQYININNLSEINENIFEFKGCTSLYDSLCEVISYASTFKDDTHIFVISDGEDNSSKNYNKESANKMCEMAINVYKYNIVHCHTDTNILNIPTITYDVNDIEHIFENLKI